MKPYYENEHGKLYHGDCLEILPTIGKVDLVLTDPPYGLNSKIHDGGWSSNKEKYIDVLEWDYIPDAIIFNMLSDISKNQIIFGGNYFANILMPSRCWIAWIKPPFPSMSEVDFAWTSFDKPSKPFYNNRVNPSIHPTQKPVQLFNQILLMYSNQDETILDPFLGSGTTALSVQEIGQGRKWIGIEKEEKYCEIAAKRIEQESRQMKLF